jgi:predicted dehydrogenase
MTNITHSKPLESQPSSQLPSINWAVLGCGHIAKTFMASVQHVKQAQVVACAASNADRAQSFAQSFNIPAHFGDYLSMLHQRNVHAVYIATTHNFHFEHIMLCLKMGKHVLCEKPLTLNASQAKQAYELAAQNNLLLVEAVWTRFLPAILALKKELADKSIGTVVCLQANFSFSRELPETHRLKNPELAGGALLDLGIYPITIADIVFDKAPVSVSSHHIPASTGVDQNSFYTLQYDSGAVAQLSAGFKMSGPTYANIMGDKGFISIPFFLGAKSYTLAIDGEEPQVKHFDFDESQNFTFEIEHVTQTLLNSLGTRDDEYSTDKVLTSSLMPAQTTLRMMTIMDTIRQQWDLSYANESL